MYLILSNSTPLFRKTDEWLGPPCQTTNMRYTLNEDSFLPFNSDRKESEMLVRSQILSGTEPCLPRAVMTLGLQRTDMSWHCTGTCHGVMKCRRQTGPLQMREQAAGCCLPLFERKAVCSLSSLGCTLTPQLKLCFNLHRCITFLITQAKHLPLWIKNVTKVIVSSVQPFLLSFPLYCSLHLIIFSQPFLTNVLIFSNT